MKGIEEDIDRCLLTFGLEHAYAVRSSATAEDLPFASFAGMPSKGGPACYD